MNKRTIIGVLILAVGFMLLAGSFGYIETRGLWSTFWPVILIAIGLVNLVDGPRNYVFSGLMLSFGTIFLLRNLGFDYFYGIDFWDMFWPLVLIIVGVWFLTSKKNRSFAKGKREVSDDLVDTMVIFSGSDMLNQSQNFRGGQATALFGGIDMDLRHAEIVNRPAKKMDVFAAFGGVDIKVPEHWRVKVTGIPLFGGWGNKTANKENASKEIDLEINCLVLFGGFDVKN